MKHVKPAQHKFPGRKEPEMVSGIISILRQVKDLDNRREIAHQQLRQFKREGIAHDRLDFLGKLDLD